MIYEGAEHTAIFRPISEGVGENISSISKFLYVENPFYEVLEKFSRVFGEVFLIIGGVEHALVFKAPFQGCQHGVCEKVSLRGLLMYCPSFSSNFRFRSTVNFTFG